MRSMYDPEATLAKKPRRHPAKSDNPHGAELVYRLRVDLKGIRPPIWRRFTILGAVSLYQLHEAIQTVMEWGGGHLYCFSLGTLSFGDPDPDLDLSDARKVTLQAVAPIERCSFTYVYDFGDDWQHTVLVEQILPRMPDEVVPQVLKGKRNRPPEDVGGAWAYADFLAILANPQHPDHEEMLDWAGGDWDPEEFDLEWCQKSLHALAVDQHWARPKS